MVFEIHSASRSRSFLANYIFFCYSAETRKSFLLRQNSSSLVIANSMMREYELSYCFPDDLVITFEYIDKKYVEWKFDPPNWTQGYKFQERYRQVSQIDPSAKILNIETEDLSNAPLQQGQIDVINFHLNKFSVENAANIDDKIASKKRCYKSTIECYGKLPLCVSTTIDC